MVDDTGREIPGTRGYKYFGRAKDLPGVKELLTKSAEQAEEAEEGYKAQRYQRFSNQPPSYLGDDDEDDGVLLAEEQLREEEMWSDALDDIAQQLGHESASPATLQGLLGVPAELPRRKAEGLKAVMQRQSSSASTSRLQIESGEADDEATQQGKRKKKGANINTTDASASSTAEKEGGVKRSKTEAEGTGEDDLLAQILPALDPSQLTTPRVPDRKETEAFILRERKRMLREEYSIGDAASKA